MTENPGGGERSEQSSDSGAAGAADAAAAQSPQARVAGSVEAGWLRPHARRTLGRPRISTILLVLLWIAVLVLYLQVRP
ncbi:hypothetical protein [Nocardia wallacei]|uniref:hypothetical protein n=1 Tax=Nocardia wallacei TaxID=480035 RepID=UPI0024554EF5|nr:hypothetical protein [Nocardia wallacei]